jgi:CO/xanthine dehydrogenase Mo-binding subunit
MTGLLPEENSILHEKEFSRKSFVKGGGALVVSFSVLGAVAGKAAAAQVDPLSNPGAADPNIFTSYGPFDSNAMDSWFAVHPDNSISVKLGKVELGQGSATGLSMIVAEELDHDMNLMRVIENDTDITPNSGATVGSQSIQNTGKAYRAAAAYLRQTLLGMAATKLGVPAGSLSISNGIISSSGGAKTTAGELIGGKLISVTIPASYGLAGGAFTPAGTGLTAGTYATHGAGVAPGFPGLVKSLSDYKLVGKASPQRLDIPAKVNGTYTYVHNVKIPGMLHGRVVRPRGQGAAYDGVNPKVLSVDPKSIAHVPDVQIVQVGDFIGVVAKQEFDAIQAAAQLKVTWAPMPKLAGSGNMWQQMRDFDKAGQAPARYAVEIGNVNTAIAGAAHTVSQSYSYPYNGHFPIGPACSIAWVTKDGCRVYSNAQNIYAVRSSVANVLGLTATQVRVSYYEGSSCYGASPQNDPAEAAALMSKAVGAPVRVQYMRWDEHGWDNYGPPFLHDIRGGVDANGNIVAIEDTQFGIPAARIDPAELNIGLTQKSTGITYSTSGNSDTNNSGTQYNLKNRRVISKSLPLQNNYFRNAPLRAPNAPQTTFAYEQFVDELAYAAKMDPYQFRLQNVATQATDMANGLTALTWDRWKNVLTKAAQMANWQPRVANSVKQTGNVRTGRGIALGTFANTMVCNVAEVSVNMKSGKITPTQFWCAQDTGLTVYPDGVVNQGVGSLIMGASRALYEQVGFNTKQVTSLDWVTYPIMRFKDAPKIDFQFIQRTDIPATTAGTTAAGGTTIPSSTVAASGVFVSGSGEPPLSSIGAAMANAFFDATGARIRTAPMSPERVRGVLKSAGLA